MKHSKITFQTLCVIEHKKRTFFCTMIYIYTHAAGAQAVQNQWEKNTNHTHKKKLQEMYFGWTNSSLVWTNLLRIFPQNSPQSRQGFLFHRLMHVFFSSSSPVCLFIPSNFFVYVDLCHTMSDLWQKSFVWHS